MLPPLPVRDDDGGAPKLPPLLVGGGGNNNNSDVEAHHAATVVPLPPNPLTSTCQYCHRLGGTHDELILPCINCPTRYAHRSCLNRHRVDVDHPERLVSCPNCDGDFRLLPSRSAANVRRLRFHAYVLRDFLLIFCLVQLVLVLLAVVVRAIDNALAFCLASCQPPRDQHHDPTPPLCVECAPIINTLFPRSMSEDHARFTYYVCGIVLFFAFIGLFGLCAKCLESNEQIALPVAPPERHHAPVHVVCCPSGHHHHHRHHGTSSCDCMDCCCRCCCNDCSGCDCKCDGGKCDGDCKEGAVVIIVILALLVVCFAFVGLFCGVVLATVVFQRVTQRHLHLLDLQQLASDYPVADVAAAPSVSSSSDDHVPYAEVVQEVRRLL